MLYFKLMSHKIRCKLILWLQWYFEKFSFYERSLFVLFESMPIILFLKIIFPRDTDQFSIWYFQNSNKIFFHYSWKYQIQSNYGSIFKISLRRNIATRIKIIYKVRLNGLETLQYRNVIYISDNGNNVLPKIIFLILCNIC